MHVLVIPDVMDSRVVQDCRSDTVEMVSCAVGCCSSVGSDGSSLLQ